MLIGIDANSRTLQWPPNLWHLKIPWSSLELKFVIIHWNWWQVTFNLIFLKAQFAVMKNWKEKARACASWRHGASARGRRRGQRADKVPTSSVAWPTRIRSEAHAPLSSRFLTFRDCAHLSTSGSGRNFFFQRQPTNRWIVRSSACGHFTGLTFGIRVSNWTIQVCHLFQFFNWIFIRKISFFKKRIT